MEQNEKDFLQQLSRLVGQEDYDRESIKSRFGDFKKYMRTRFSFDCPIVIVGGTNGKGSVVENLNLQARASRLNTVVWTSPHIESLVERYQYNNINIEWTLLEDLIRKELTQNEMKFSLFELFFVVFCEWIKSLEIDLIILEVGLGGRLDAVNVFDAQVSAIASISRDHIKYLGNSYKKILIEKIQIARENKDIIVQTPLKFLHSFIKEQADVIGANAHLLSQDSSESFSRVNRRTSLAIWNSLYPLRQLNKLTIANNERVQSWNQQIHFNGAHNSDGMRQLMNHLCQNKKKQALLLAFSKRPTQEVKLLLRIVKKYESLFTQIIMTSFEHSRSLEPCLSRQIADESGIVFDSDWKKNIQQIIKDKQECLVAGSYYFVGEVKSYLGS